ncbi:YgaP family membrane protein [Sphingobacterium lactis]
MGTIDKAIRIVVALIIIALYLFKVISGTWAIVLLVVAGIFVFTSFIGVCPIYSLLGITTKKKPSTH